MPDAAEPADSPGEVRHQASPQSLSGAAWIVVAALAYGGLAQAAQALSLGRGDFATFWPPAGVYVAALLLAPRKRWPALVGALLLASLTSDVLLHGKAWWFALSLFGINSFAAIFMASLMQRIGGEPFKLEGMRQGLVFDLVTLGVCAGFSSLLGAGLVSLVFKADFLSSWGHWSLADLAGIWLITPIILQWPTRNGGSRWSAGRVAEAAALFLTLAALSYVLNFKRLPLPLLPSALMMWVFWAALRLGPTGAGVAMLIIAIPSIGATVTNQGPFIRPGVSLEESVLRGLFYLVIWSGFFQLVSAILGERRRANELLAGLNRDLEARVAERTRSLESTSEALRESETRLRLANEAAGIGTYDIDLRSKQTRYSPQMCELLGIAPGTTTQLGEGFLFVHPEDREEVVRRFESALAEEGVAISSLELRVVTPTGEVRWISWSGRTLFEESGQGRKAVRALGVALDVTARKESESALREKEERLAMAMKAAQSGSFDWDIRHDRHVWSDELLELYGVAPEGFSGQFEDWYGYIVPEDRDAAKAAIRNAIESGRYSLQFRIRRQDNGEIRWIDARGTVTQDSEGRATRMLGINLDITERKRVEEAWEESEAALRRHSARQTALLELTRTILSSRAEPAELGRAVFARMASVLDADLGFQYGFQAEKNTLTLLASLGLTAEAEVISGRLDLGEGFVAGGGPLPTEAAQIAGHTHAALLRGLGAQAFACHALFSSDGRLLGTLSLASTARERFAPEELEFIQTLAHFTAIAWERCAAEAAMLRAKEGAESASRAKDDFLAALSHELRTPLNPVLLLASELQNAPDLSAEMRGDLTAIRRNVELEARLIDDLLDLTRITRGKLKLEVRRLEAHRVLRDALEILDGDLKLKNLDLTLDLAAPRDAVIGDAVRLQQVFWNVLRNAIKFTPPGGAVRIVSREEPAGRLSIAVSDTGPGIEPEHLETIFDTFQQGDGGHRFGGLGLGLAIARSLAVMHRGTIRAQSAGLGLGSTFLIELPLAQAPANGNHGAPTLPAPVEKKPQAHLEILLVEDHEPTRHVLSRLLQRRGHRVSVAENLATGRALAHGAKFDLLISDLGLPDGDGTELMQELSLAGGPPGIALSGFGTEDDLARSLRAGFYTHLIKPVDVQALERAVANRPSAPAEITGSERSAGL